MGALCLSCARYNPSANRTSTRPPPIFRITPCPYKTLHFSNTLASNGATGSAYYPCWGSACNSEVIFNAGTALVSHRHQFSVVARLAYSSSSSSFVNLTGKVHYAQPTKKPLHLRGYSNVAIPLISRIAPPELAPFLPLCRGVAGLHRAVSLHLSG